MGRPQNCNCNCAGPPIWIDYQRRIRCLGPLLSDTTIPGHTGDWLFGKFIGPSFDDHLLSWNDFWFYANQNNVPGSNTYPGEYLLRPIRFSLTGWQPESAATASGISISNDALFNGTGPNILQNSRFTPPATSDGHFSGSQTSTVSISRGILSTNLDSSPTTIVAARVRIDGVDVSGVRTLNIPMIVSAGLYTGYGPRESQSFGIPLSTTVNVSDAKEMTIDLWIKFKVTATEAQRNPLDEGGQLINNQPVSAPWNWWAPMVAALGTHPMPMPNNPFHRNAIPFVVPGQINAHRRIRASDTWTVTFSGAQFAGLSTLVLQPQSGWTFVRNQTQIIMSRPSGIPFTRNWRIVFSYGTECPELQVIRPTGPYGGGLRYHIQSPSYYEAHSPYNVPHAPLTSTGSNTFIPTLYFNPSTSTPTFLPVAAVPTLFPEFPSSISIVRS